jgi:hypothetical protein
MRMAINSLSDFDAGTRCYEAGEAEKALVFFRQGALAFFHQRAK